jgi:pyrrolidone-carboxylate peptidase
MAVKRVVLTGYEPWAHAAENPTIELLDRARERNIPDVELITIRVPVETNKITPLVDEALDEYQPDIWPRSLSGPLCYRGRANGGQCKGLSSC